MKQKKLKGLEKLAEVNRQLQTKAGPYYEKWLHAILKGIKAPSGARGAEEAPTPRSKTQNSWAGRKKEVESDGE
ncbi:MAG: hypothetical protein APZ16_04545 [Candidatus Hadarchaeum yellowstonense]|uniref:Uncharacterized protein n=1 Tax=Hadarchaeum yellowstonense TaxID=1776334 RepID=A0A147JVZ4_HADYE|nr:MAG: hypothetical protein APZ16_04545 [Candidatus Hadarchaeum yellowstonense]